MSPICKSRIPISFLSPELHTFWRLAVSSLDLGPWSSHFPPLSQDDSAAHSEHQDPISLAVEMAAVNHTILALSRTGGVSNDIKTESLEDE